MPRNETEFEFGSVRACIHEKVDGKWINHDEFVTIGEPTRSWEIIINLDEINNDVEDAERLVKDLKAAIRYCKNNPL